MGKLILTQFPGTVGGCGEKAHLEGSAVLWHHKCAMRDEVAEAGSQVTEALNTWLKFGFCHSGESLNDLQWESALTDV